MKVLITLILIIFQLSCLKIESETNKQTKNSKMNKEYINTIAEKYKDDFDITKLWMDFINKNTEYFNSTAKEKWEIREYVLSLKPNITIKDKIKFIGFTQFMAHDEFSFIDRKQIIYLECQEKENCIIGLKIKINNITGKILKNIYIQIILFDENDNKEFPHEDFKNVLYKENHKIEVNMVAGEKNKISEITFKKNIIFKPLVSIKAWMAVYQWDYK